MTTKLLSGKIAIVTGASSGIGRATALAFAKHGATVVCADRSQVHQATHEVVQRQGGTSEFFQTDVSDEGSVLRLIKGTVAKFGRLDMYVFGKCLSSCSFINARESMVNNAGIASEAANPRPIWETPESVFDDTWRVNARGVFLGCKYAGMQMLRQGDASQNRNRAGAIINVGSVLGVLGKAGTPAYAATKGAVIAMTRAAAMDFAPHKIYCNSVLPGCKCLATCY